MAHDFSRSKTSSFFPMYISLELPCETSSLPRAAKFAQISKARLVFLLAHVELSNFQASELVVLARMAELSLAPINTVMTMYSNYKPVTNGKGGVLCNHNFMPLHPINNRLELAALMHC
jgi:hypothetical protein